MANLTGWNLGVGAVLAIVAVFGVRGLARNVFDGEMQMRTRPGGFGLAGRVARNEQPELFWLLLLLRAATLIALMVFFFFVAIFP